MNKSRMPIRLICYFGGLFIMTIGIAISVKSNLGVAPVSSIPYAMTCIWGIEMGKATIIFHAFLVVIQIIILRKNFKIKNLLQVLVGVVFGYMTTASNSIMALLPDPTNIVVRLLMMLASAFLIALGLFFYVPANIVPLAGEGLILAISDVTGIKFSTVKIIFDASIVAIALVACLIMIHSMGSVGAGTIIAAFLVGAILKLIIKIIGPWRDKLLGNEVD